MTTSKRKELSFEDAFKRLESIVENLEKGESTLEESLKTFEEGMALVKICSQKLKEAEARIQKLVQDKNGDFFLETFE